jgi:hypothetical protein
MGRARVVPITDVTPGQDYSAARVDAGPLDKPADLQPVLAAVGPLPRTSSVTGLSSPPSSPTLTAMIDAWINSPDPSVSLSDLEGMDLSFGDLSRGPSRGPSPVLGGPDLGTGRGGPDVGVVNGGPDVGPPTLSPYMLSLRAEDISGDEDWDLPTLIAVDYEQRSSSNAMSTPSPPATVVTSPTHPPNTVQAGDGIAGSSGANRATPSVETGPTTSVRSTSPVDSPPLDFWVADNGRVHVSPINVLHPPGVVALLRANPSWALDDLLARLIDEGRLPTSGLNWKSRYAALCAIEYGQRAIVDRVLQQLMTVEHGTLAQREAVFESVLREFEAVRNRPAVASGLTVMRQRDEAQRRAEAIVISSDDDD